MLTGGDESRDGVSPDVADGPGEDVLTDCEERLLGRRRVSSLEDMTRVWPPKMARRDAEISVSGPMFS